MAQELVKLFNKGKRTIQGVHADVIDPKTGKPQKYAFAPNTPGAFSKPEADRLRRMFKNEVLALDDVQRQFEQTTSLSPDKKAEQATISVEKAEQEKLDAVTVAVAEALAAERERMANPAGNTAGDSAPGEDFAERNTIAKAAGAAPGKKK